MSERKPAEDWTCALEPGKGVIYLDNRLKGGAMGQFRLKGDGLFLSRPLVDPKAEADGAEAAQAALAAGVVEARLPPLHHDKIIPALQDFSRNARAGARSLPEGGA